jgi:hypothetical protein
VFIVVLLIPATASADGHRAGLFGGYSVARGSTLSGFHVSFDYAGNDPEKHIFAGVLDYSVHDGDGFQRQTFLGGFEASVRLFNQFAGAAHVLFGSTWGDDHKSFSTAFGGTFEWIGRRRAAGAPGGIRLAPAVKYDYIYRADSAESFWRVSTGVVVRFPKG